MSHMLFWNVVITQGTEALFTIKKLMGYKNPFLSFKS